ncbi:Asp-tRNA(Asn)/Glu-tRNA(Gln) amidotransferase subunit GatB [Ravibacter arvi]|uniref:Asp-tRNA(Asn)/Glu-tRNA(Gln) amidotransferase subunit GatB n=1 Tax=Ravibacter arvi TaxID=2051041 RepID=UPI0031EBACBD
MHQNNSQNQSARVSDRYETVIGLEVHCQLLTESKIFTPDDNRFGSAPNTNIGFLTLALPGTLPRLNKKTIELGVRLGFACGSSISRTTIFDRKNYFYPDLPKGYQITQDKAPICVGGGVKITNREGEEKTIRLHHAHLEEDAGKSVHDGSETDTLLDYNRAGTPLIEIVSEPDLRSAEETGLYLTEVRRIVRYLDISDGNMEEGSFRADVNISLRLVGASEYGTKVEIKNMNSIRNIMRAIEYEQSRQADLLDKGEKIVQETRMYDVDRERTYGMRLKETLNDYRYFPDPDLSPVVLSDEWLAKIRSEMPALPWEVKERFVSHYGLPQYDAGLLSDEKEQAFYFEEVCKHCQHFKTVSNWLIGPIRSYLNENGLSIAEFPIQPKTVADLVELIESGVINHTIATQKLFPALLENPESAPQDLAQANNWIQNSNTGELETLIEQVLNGMPDKVAAYKKGKKGLIGLFVGEVMKKTGSTADPKVVNQILNEKLA